MKREAVYSVDEVSSRGLEIYVVNLYNKLNQLDGSPRSKRIAGEVCSASRDLLVAAGLWPRTNIPLPAKRSIIISRLPESVVSRYVPKDPIWQSMIGLTSELILIYQRGVSVLDLLRYPVSALTTDYFNIWLDQKNGPGQRYSGIARILGSPRAVKIDSDEVHFF